MTQRRASTAALLALTCVLAACGTSPGASSRDGAPAADTPRADGSATPPRGDDARVTRVIDGDTIEVELGGRRVTVRYIGIDTPETVDPKRPQQCFGKEASDYNKQLVSGKRVRLEQDVSETDTFGRLLRYVYVDGTMVNERLVREGYAHASAYPPDVKHQPRLVEAQRDAREAARGLWTACPAPSATETRAASTVAPPSPGSTCAAGCEAPPPGCVIKGNINAEGTRIYHVPGGVFYEQTVVSPDRGERWFCTEGEATSNGWRRSQQ